MNEPRAERSLHPPLSNSKARFSNRPIWVKHFRLSTAAVSMSLAGSRFSSDSAPGPSIMGFEDEVEQSFGRPCQTNGRFKRTYELTSSIVPRGTLFHHAVELECSPVRLDTVQLCHAATASRVQRNSVPSTQIMVWTGRASTSECQCCTRAADSRKGARHD